MKRAAIGDVHLSGFQSDTLEKNGLPLRLSLIIQSLDFVVEKCRNIGITNFDILGDLIHDKSIIYTIAQEAFEDFLKRNKDKSFRIISGNHDMSSTGELQKSAISVFSEYENVECISYQPQIIGNITYIPYSDKFLEIIKETDPNTILISHLGLNEAMLQSGLSKIDKISIRDLSKFDLAILGHYHKPQYIEGSKTDVYYAGSLIHRDWNDKNEQKRFLVYDTESLQVESINIEGLREFKEFVINEEDDKTQVLRLAEIATNDGHIVRIKNKSQTKISDDLSGGVLVIEQQEIDITNRGIEITQTTDQQLKKFLEIKEIPEEEREDYLAAISKYSLVKLQGE